jgi:hypothetical protein
MRRSPHRRGQTRAQSPLHLAHHALRRGQAQHVDPARPLQPAQRCLNKRPGRQEVDHIASPGSFVNVRPHAVRGRLPGLLRPASSRSCAPAGPAGRADTRPPAAAARCGRTGARSGHGSPPARPPRLPTPPCQYHQPRWSRSRPRFADHSRLAGQPGRECNCGISTKDLRSQTRSSRTVVWCPYAAGVIAHRR